MPSKPQSKPQTADQQPHLDEVQRRAAHAKQLLEDPMLQEAFRVIEKEYTEAFLNTSYEDIEGRERCYRMTHAITQLENQLREVLNNGKLQTRRVQNTVKGTGN